MFPIRRPGSLLIQHWHRTRLSFVFLPPQQAQANGFDNETFRLWSNRLNAGVENVTQRQRGKKGPSFQTRTTRARFCLVSR